MVAVLKHPLTLLIVLFSTLFILMSLYKTLEKTRSSSEAIGVLEQENVKMASEVSELEARLNQAETSLTQEKIIRNELLMQKPGEYVIQLPEVAVTENQAQPTPSPSAWQEWKKVLF
ncbi:MAG TPA: septum formation initiator family protein [Vitreimonas sp.]|nr:septum formation initiator family protein [Vitreimonas sp.]